MLEKGVAPRFFYVLSGVLGGNDYEGGHIRPKLCSSRARVVISAQNRVELVALLEFWAEMTLCAYEEEGFGRI
ncbi:hypothetical protein ALMA_0978 [Alloscardovia macacae]|uniref:Uncharacterized protein n=1 Tax=Alloscardovia macacae TaxID=1160091 RepID=A0A261F5V2_9BIFI|nr:hypothetical protein ALMA_0978 [Alloscardovia macacae]